MSISPVAVYLLASDANSTRTSKVNDLFKSPLFVVNVMVISPPSNLESKDGLSQDDLVENYRINWCLSDAKKRYPNSHVLVVKDTSISDASPDRIANAVSAAIRSGREDPWHLFYLSKWLDRCDLYSDKKPINGTMTTIAKTMSPKGFQAIVFSPDARDIVLGAKDLPRKAGSPDSSEPRSFYPLNKPLGTKLHESVLSGDLKAVAAVPNLIRYDISAAKDAKDYEKLNECEIVDAIKDASMINSKQLQETVGNVNTGIWLFIILIIILIVVFFVLKRNNKI